MAAEIVRQEVFEGTPLAVIEHEGEEWFPAQDIGRALGFEKPWAEKIHQIYRRSRDEFEELSVAFKLKGTGQENPPSPQEFEYQALPRGKAPVTAFAQGYTDKIPDTEKVVTIPFEVFKVLLAEADYLLKKPVKN